MQGMPSILSLFRIEFNKFNYTGGTYVRFYLSHDIKIILKSYFWLEKSYYFAICITLKSLFHKVVYRFYRMAFYHSQTRHHVIKKHNP